VLQQLRQLHLLQQERQRQDLVRALDAQITDNVLLKQQSIATHPAFNVNNFNRQPFFQQHQQQLLDRQINQVALKKTIFQNPSMSSQPGRPKSASLSLLSEDRGKRPESGDTEDVPNKKRKYH
jgi:hypothetical protein